jgi:hypothetical protein
MSSGPLQVSFMSMNPQAPKAEGSSAGIAPGELDLPADLEREVLPAHPKSGALLGILFPPWYHQPWTGHFFREFEHNRLITRKEGISCTM